jgi:hypothetical protein
MAPNTGDHGTNNTHTTPAFTTDALSIWETVEP